MIGVFIELRFNKACFQLDLAYSSTKIWLRGLQADKVVEDVFMLQMMLL